MMLHFFNYPLSLLTTFNDCGKLCGYCQSLGLVFGVCIIINVWYHMHMCVSFILESNCMCLHGWMVFNMNIHLTKSFYPFVVHLLCSEPCARH